MPPKSPDILNIAHLEANVATSDTNVATSDNNVATSLRSQENLRRIKQRLSSDEMKQLIIDICNNWISLEELADRINRNASYLRIHIIPPLIKDKSIEKLYPGTPNHPNQKYKVPD